MSNPSSKAEAPLKIALYMQEFWGGGIERLFVGLAAKFIDAGHSVDFLVNKAEGPFLASVPSAASVVTIGGDKPAKSVPGLVRYMRGQSPDIVMSGHDHANIAIMLAGLFAPKVQIVPGQHNSLKAKMRIGVSNAVVPSLYKLLAWRANAFVSVSEGVAREVRDMAGVPAAKSHVIYNGVVSAEGGATPGAEAVAYFDSIPKRPSIVAAGRMVDQKDFATLITAFSILRKSVDANLVIFGEGPLRQDLTALASEKGVASDVFMPGYVDKILSYIAQADLFVLSSKYEGFGNVLVEALSCGVPVVSTDCESGPSEILRDGEYGLLTPVGDVESLAKAMRDQLAATHDVEHLKSRAGNFSEGRCAAAYMDLFRKLKSN